MRRRHLLCCTLLAVSVIACTIPTAIAQQASTRTEIEAANSVFEATAKKGDGAAMAALYTADAQLLAPFTPPIKGRDGIAAAFANPMNIDLTTLEVEDLGDTAYEIGAYTITGLDGKAVDEGKYTVIWKHEGGGWKLHRDIWNSNMPPPSGATSQAALPRAAEGETIGIAIYSVKPDKKEAFEHFVREVLTPAAREVEPQVEKHIRFWAPAPDQPDDPDSEPWGDGLPYAFVFDPYMEDGDYDMESVLAKVHGPEKAAQYMQEFSTYVNGYTYTHFTQE